MTRAKGRGYASRMADPSPPPAPSPEPASAWLLARWAACRALWITAFPLAFGLVMLVAPADAIQRGRYAAAPLTAIPSLIAFLLVWWSIRDTWRVATRRTVYPAGVLRGEVRATTAAAVIGALLLASVWPSFKDLMRYGAEGAAKGNLGALRHTVDEYQGAHEGLSPESLDALVRAGKVELRRLWPRFSRASHPPTDGAIVVSGRDGTDSGKWAYVVSASSPALTGAVFIDCTHTDAKGSVWTSY